MYIALSDVNFDWEEHEIESVKKAYSDGLSPGQIARKVSRTIEEVCVLLIDMNRKNVGILYGLMPFDPQYRELKIKNELSKELYLVLKEQGYKDADLCDEWAMSSSTLVKMKRQWGLTIKKGGDRRSGKWKDATRI